MSCSTIKTKPSAAISQIKRELSRIALLVGNGVNRYDNRDRDCSWENLLRHIQMNLKGVKDCNRIESGKGLGATEFFDLLWLDWKYGDGEVGTAVQARDKASKTLYTLQKIAADELKGWPIRKAHRAIVTFAQNNKLPLLTTNFDLCLEGALNREFTKVTHLTQRLRRADGLPATLFTQYHPWACYVTSDNEPLAKADERFAIWHIHGLALYPKSLKLGLNHYLAAAERARSILSAIQSSKDYSLPPNWLEIVLKRKLLIVGLSLEEREVFLRWLLIRRAAMLKKLKREWGNDGYGWYVHCLQDGGDLPSGQRAFLEACGIKVVTLAWYSNIYEALLRALDVPLKKK